jgi:hypothetical protein
MSTLLSLSYWFGTQPPPFMPAVERGLLIGFAAWMVIGIGMWIFLMKQGMGKPMRRGFEKAATLFTWSGLTGLVLWSFEYEEIPVLSMRIFFVLVLAWIAYGLYSIVRYATVEVPTQRRIEEEREAREKWLPKRKK